MIFLFLFRLSCGITKRVGVEGSLFAVLFGASIISQDRFLDLVMHTDNARMSLIGCCAANRFCCVHHKRTDMTAEPSRGLLPFLEELA